MPCGIRRNWQLLVKFARSIKRAAHQSAAFSGKPRYAYCDFPGLPTALLHWSESLSTLLTTKFSSGWSVGVVEVACPGGATGFVAIPRWTPAPVISCCSSRRSPVSSRQALFRIPARRDGPREFPLRWWKSGLPNPCWRRTRVPWERASAAAPACSCRE
jgi:hypothetical protein